MTKWTLAVGTVALALSTMALAGPGGGHGGGGSGGGHGGGGGSGGGHGGGHATAQGHANHGMMSHHGGKAKAKTTRKGSHGLVTRDRHGRLFALDARGSCPPGLAKRNNGCLPPGQAKKLYNVGQRYNRNFGNPWTYNQIPNDLRTQYSLDQSGRYYYNNGYLYQVDPKTMLIQQVISAIQH